MVLNEEKEMRWIREHLNIRHDELMSSEARHWNELIENDFLNFSRLAVFGFSMQLESKGHKVIPGDAVSTFLKEFQYKIFLAVSGDCAVCGLPLFEICGVEIIGEELLKSDESYRIQASAQA